MKYLFILILGFFLAACSYKPIVISGGQPTTHIPSTTRYTNYEEDLSVVRPKYKEATLTPETTTPKIQKATTDLIKPVNHEVDAILDTIAIQNRAIRYAVGYRIQIYVGNVRTDAEASKLYIYQNFPELLPYMSYSVPTYRVKIGDFMTKIDAERYLQQVKSQFPSSVILPEKIDIRKTLSLK